MKKFVLIAFTVILSGVVEVSYAQDAESAYELVKTVELQVGPEPEGFQLICSDDAGAYAVHYNFDTKLILAFDIKDGYFDNSNQTEFAKFYSNKSKIEFRTKHILDFLGQNILDMTFYPDNRILNIHSLSSGKDYTLNCEENR